MHNLFVGFKGWFWAAVTILWFASFTLADHSGLGLTIDTKSGEKHCIDRLASFLGVSQENGFTGLLGTVSVILSLALPIISIIVIAMIIYRKNRRSPEGRTPQ
jgi:hypothetical protein